MSSLLLLLSGLVAPRAFAQETVLTPPVETPVPPPSYDRSVLERARATEPSLPLDGIIDPALYRLGPGDELALDIAGRMSATARSTVDPEGNLTIQDFGRLHVAGLTLTEARESVRRMFHGASRGIDVTLRLVSLRRIKVYAAGEVRSPGVIEVTAATRASEIVEKAGGLTAAASRRNLVLRHADGAVTGVDLVRFERIGDRAANPYASDGDQLFVPRQGDLVYLYAPVPYDGGYEFRPGDRIKDLVAMGGGLLPQALPANARLLRFTDPASPESLSIDLASTLGDGAAVALEPGDRLFVPSRTNFRADRHFAVLGEVRNAGSYPLREGVDRLSTAIAAAGGFTSDAAQHSVLLIREDGTPLDRDPEFQRLSRLSRGEMTSSEYQAFRTKLASAQTTFVVDASKLDASRDVLLQADDVIRVERIDYSVRVSGRVRRPGLVAYQAGLSGQDYIVRAGGYSARADAGQTRVTRASTGQTLALRDVRDIAPGDLVYVPDKPDKNLLAGLRDVLLVAGSIATVVIAFRK